MIQPAPNDISTIPLPPTSGQSAAATPADVLDFWLGDGLTHEWPTQDLGKRWFGGGAALDEEIRTRFGAQVVHALAGGLTDWEETPLTRLALTILLDQFTRNVFRASPQAFAGDARAQKLTLQTLARHEDLGLSWVARVFSYMPLMHAEDLPLQDECVARFTSLVADAPGPLKERLQGNLDFARQHRDIITQFGRFPHRNTALGRASTPEESDFLVNGPRFGQ
ncbi:MAG: DUF924 family protein [Polaromonas sp.]